MAYTPRSFDAESAADWKAWAEFLTTWVEYRHGSDLCSPAWDDFMAGKGPYDG